MAILVPAARAKRSSSRVWPTVSSRRLLFTNPTLPSAALTVPPSCATLIFGDAPEPPVSPPLAGSPVLTVSGASLLTPSAPCCILELNAGAATVSKVPEGEARPSDAAPAFPFAASPGEAAFCCSPATSWTAPWVTGPPFSWAACAPSWALLAVFLLRYAPTAEPAAPNPAPISAPPRALSPIWLKTDRNAALRASSSLAP